MSGRNAGIEQTVQQQINRTSSLCYICLHFVQHDYFQRTIIIK